MSFPPILQEPGAFEHHNPNHIPAGVSMGEPMSQYDAAHSCIHSQRESQPATLDQGLMHASNTSSRCYWVLLTTDLTFLHIDPYLVHDLKSDADGLLGKSLLEFAHPNDRADCEEDVNNVLRGRIMHGSVTLVRYSRLTRIHQLLKYRGPLANWTDGETADEEYMPVELVINLAADGLVLCFIHTYPFLQVFDRDATARARSIDTCGDDNLSIADVHTLFHRLHQTIPPSSRVERVFQLLANGPRRQLLMSWPSDQFQEAAANEFAKLASSTQLGDATDSSSTTPRGTTSCTKRYKSLGFVSLGDGAGLKNVESVFIPHGSIIFACHKIHPTAPPLLPDTAQPAAYEYQQTPYYESNSYSRVPPPPYNHSYPGHNSQHLSAPSGHYYGSWNESSPHQSHYGSWPPHSNPLYSPSRSVSHNDASSSSYQPYDQESEVALSTSLRQGRSPGYVPHLDDKSEDSAAHPLLDAAPPIRRRTSPTAVRDSTSHGVGSRNSGAPPTGVQHCASCQAVTSPEWRKGPSGKKDLCNACGLRYSRLKAKSQGIVTQRRKKSTASELGGPPLGLFTNERRDDGSDMKPTSPLMPAGMPSQPVQTPSPSPPANSVTFSHYSYHQPHQADPRYAQAGGTYSAQPSAVYEDVLRPPRQGDVARLPRVNSASQYTASTVDRYAFHVERDGAAPPAAPVATDYHGHIHNSSHT